MLAGARAVVIDNSNVGVNACGARAVVIDNSNVGVKHLPELEL